MKTPYTVNVGDKTPIGDLDLSLRIEHALQINGIKTVGDLAFISEWDLFGVPNFGKKSLQDLRQALEAHQQKMSASLSPEWEAGW